MKGQILKHIRTTSIIMSLVYVIVVIVRFLKRFSRYQLCFLRKFCHFIVAQSMPQTIVFTRTQITPLNEQYERNRKNQSYALHLL